MSTCPITVTCRSGSNSSAPVTARPPLPGDTTVDVAIVGGGYTGLWSAYYLQQLDPSLRIAVLDKEVSGFGASGRNGGWCSALYAVTPSTLAAEHGRDAARAQWHAMRDSVDEIERVCTNEAVEADVVRGGTVVLARSQPQLERARAEVAESDEYDLDVSLLDAADASRRVNATDVLGATFTPHCAALQPAKLARGLAELVERRGAAIYEQTAVTGVEDHCVRTGRGTVRADHVLLATEGYTARLAGHRRDVAPVYSLIVATEPLPERTWDEIGLAERETFSDFRHLIIYGQRSADGRLVLGGRGAPYHFASRIEAGFDRDGGVFDALARTVVELFPVLDGVPITHRWGGPLGIARDWHPSVGYDPASGLGRAGGYVGDGVSTANLAGRTLADLVTGRTTELTALPWVGHEPRRWEPEPLRWVGANLGLQAMAFADRAEARGRRSSRLATVVDKVIGR